MTTDNPAKASLEIEQQEQREAARNRHPDSELSDALKRTFPASDPIAVQAPVTPGAAPEMDIGTVSDGLKTVKRAAASGLKSVNATTSQVADVTTERAGELQKLLVDEIRARPLQALGWAAAIGAIFGFWAAK